MGVCVFFIDIMAVIGADERDARFGTHFHQCLIDDLLLTHTMILQFQEEIAFAENFKIFQRRFLCFFVGSGQDISGHFSCQAGTGSDQPFAVFSQKFLIHTRFVIKTFREAIGNQFDQILIALVIFRKEHHMIITAALAFFFETGALRHIDLAADDGLYACILCRFIKLNSTVHGAMVCNGDTVHPQFLHPLHQFLDLRRAIQQAVFRMDMQMRKRHHIDNIHFVTHFTHLPDLFSTKNCILYQLNIISYFFFQQNKISQKIHSKTENDFSIPHPFSAFLPIRTDIVPQRKSVRHRGIKFR